MSLKYKVGDLIKIHLLDTVINSSTEWEDVPKETPIKTYKILHIFPKDITCYDYCLEFSCQEYGSWDIKEKNIKDYKLPSNLLGKYTRMVQERAIIGLAEKRRCEICQNIK